MKTAALFLAVAAALGALPSAASAADVIDQNQPDHSLGITYFNASLLAQSFTPVADNVSGAGVFLWEGHGRDPMTLTIDLMTGLPGSPGGATLASASKSVAQSGAWVDVFWDPVAVTAGTTYYLVFRATPPVRMEDSYLDYYGIAGAGGNSYAGGKIHVPPFLPTWDVYDYAFRTYADDRLDVSPAPEPAGWALMIAGFGAAGSALRRRARAAARPT